MEDGGCCQLAIQLVMLSKPYARSQYPRHCNKGQSAEFRKQKSHVPLQTHLLNKKIIIHSVAMAAQMVGLFIEMF